MDYEQLKEVVDGLEGFKSRLQENVENIERKVNRLHIGGQSDTAGFDAPEVFSRTVKSWNPARGAADVAGGYGDYKAAFGKYVRSGQHALNGDEQKAMQVGIDNDGGYLAPSEWTKTIVQVETNNSVIRRVARTLPVGAGELEIPVSLTLPTSAWVGEISTRSDTNEPDLGKIMITAREIYAQPKATQKLLDDSAFDIEAFLAEQVGRAFAEKEDLAFISGDGVTQPQGFTTYPIASTTDAAGTRPFGTLQYLPTGQAGAWPTTDALIYDLLQDVVHSLRPAYRQKAVWVLPTAALGKIRKLKTATTAEPLYVTSMSQGMPSTLLGFPVYEAEQMPAIAANSLSVAFGDFERAYWIVDRLGTRLLRDPYTDKPYVKFYTTKRVGGALVDSSAVKLVKFAAT